MRILDKYILTELLGPFIFGIAAFSSVFIGTNILFRLAQYISQYGASLLTVTKLFFYSLPGIVVLTLPMSMLLAALLSFGRLSGSSEITAMKSGGLSFYRLAAPVFIVAFLVSIFTVVFNETVVPQSKTAYGSIIRYEIERDSRPRSQEHVVIKDVKQGELARLTYARKFEENTNTLYTITLQEFEKDRLVRVENAEKAIWQNGRWIMYNGIVYDMTADGKIERSLRFAQQNMPVEKLPGEISREQKKPEEMTIKELKQHIKALQNEFIKTSNLEVELQQRLAIPMASLVFAMIGTPLGLQPHRSSSSIGLGLSIIIILIYYAVMTVCTALGQGGVIPPVIAAWTPNILGLIVGALFVRRAAR